MRAVEIDRTGVGSAVSEEHTVQVLHSCHLNAAHLRVLYEAEGVDAAAILREAAAAAADHLPSAPPHATRDERRACVVATVAAAGLGRAELSRLDEDGQGEVRLYGSHFARAWTGRFRSASKPVCAATGEILAVLLSRVEGRRIDLRETACAAKGASSCVFRAESVDEGAEFARSVSGLPDREELPKAPRGARPDAAGGPFTLLPAEFHTGLASAFEREVPLQRGAKFGNLPGILLLEAAHRGSYHLFGEILQGEEMRPLGVEARLGELLRMVGAMGWGRWEATSFLPGERLIVQIPDSAEADAYRRMHGRSQAPRCVIARGAAAAIMNLLFRRDPAAAALGDTDYNRVFRSPASFRAVETRCRATGDSICEIIANPLTL